MKARDEVWDDRHGHHVTSAGCILPVGDVTERLEATGAADVPLPTHTLTTYPHINTTISVQ